jgi:leader peptidase (prepilin peptidase)/N-methyltransferase
MIIPDKLVLAGVAAAAVSAGISVAEGRLPVWAQLGWPALGLLWPVVGGLGGLAIFVAIRAFSQLLFRREGMGLGDVKLAGAIGAMLGPALALLSFGLAVATGAALGLLLIVLRLRRRMEYLPFGPFLATAALVALVAPSGLLHSARALYERYLGLLTGGSG